MSVGVTGAVSAVAKANVAGMQAAIDAINKDGGIDGRKVALDVSDDQLDPTKAVTNLQGVLQKHPIDLAIAGNTSNVATALAPALTRDKILTFTQAGASQLNDPKTFPFTFQVGAVDSRNVQSMVANLTEKGFHRVALLVSNDALGQSSAQLFASAIPKAGMTLETETFASTDIDMTAQLQRLQATKPDALIFDAFGSPAGYILKGRTALGWNVPAIGGAATSNGVSLASISSPDQWNRLELMANYINSEEGSSTPAAKDFVKRLRAANAALDVPLHQYSTFWDVLHIVKAAAEKLHKTDAASVARAIETLGSIPADSGADLTFPVERFSSSQHAWTWTAKEFQDGDVHKFVVAGPIVDGVITPAH